MSWPEPGDKISPQTRTPSAVDLFMFSASAWLLHRIHYDLPFATGNEGHPALLIHGPLQGVYLAQAAETWLAGRARLTSITYRHLSPAYLGDTLRCEGVVTDVSDVHVDLDLWAERDDGTTTTTGRARFQKK